MAGISVQWSRVEPGEAFPPLAARPTPSGFWAWFGPRSHAMLMAINRAMAPFLAAGLGPWMGTPVGGYMLLLEVPGRRTGKTRRISLTYLVLDGAAWVMAGYGVRTRWYLNLLAHPEVVVRLPGRTVRCRAEEALDPAVRARVMPRLTRAAGLPGLLVGCNPWTASDARIVELLDWVPLVRLTPMSGELSAGPDDPGGRAWIWRQAFVLAGLVVATRVIGRTLVSVRWVGRTLQPRSAQAASSEP